MNRLSDAKERQVVTIRSIDGDTRLLTRITSIGLTVGGIVKIVHNQKKQPLLIYSRNTLIAVNRMESERITVAPYAEAPSPAGPKKEVV